MIEHGNTLWGGAYPHTWAYFTGCISDLEIPEAWVNTSWHQDSCPSYEATQHGRVLRLTIEGADPNEREWAGGPRFAVMEVDHDLGEISESLWWGDSWEEAIAIMDGTTKLDGRPYHIVLEAPNG